MDWYSIIIITLLLFTFCNGLLLVYPLTFNRSQMKYAVRETQYYFLAVTVLITIFLLVVTKQNIICILAEVNKTSLLIIISGLIACLGILFIVASLKLMKINNSDMEHLEQLQQLVEVSIFSTKNVKEQLQNYVDVHEKVLNDYGIKHLLKLFVKQYSEMNRPPLDLGQFLLNRCLEIIYSLKHFIPIPFPHINILFSLSGVGVVITLLLSIFSGVE